MNLGEKVAIGILRDFSKAYNEDFDGFTLTKFNGKKINTNDADALTNSHCGQVFRPPLRSVVAVMQGRIFE